MFPHNFGSFPTDLSLFQNFFFHKSQKNAKIENLTKLEEIDFPKARVDWKKGMKWIKYRKELEYENKENLIYLKRIEKMKG